MQILIGFILAAAVSLLAWRVGALSTSGAGAALLTGTLIFGLGGLPWAALLLTFFISSSLLSRIFRKQKISLAEKFSKGSQRDWGQVLANGGFGALLAVGYALTRQAEWIWLAFAGSMAAVNADTWSTELGVLSAVPPRLITNGNEVERGTSGGITVLGILAALVGTMVIGIVAVIATPTQFWLLYLIAIILGGLAGSGLDSLLGATVQAIYWCPTCQKETERYPLHTCGTPTQRVRGWAWFNNDVVNFCCSIMGAIVTAVIWVLFL
jgi:uncharacterized protein (TIGR00297 family)